jgi:dTDP-4-amino-4,6-dideoxygalactose transaminase
MAQLAVHGGPRACEVEWPKWPVWDDRERSGLLGVLESGDWWYGAKVREFEARFAEFQGARYGVTATSGTTALEAMLLAAGVGAGHEVIVPPVTFVATASAVLRVNAIPVFADVEPDTWCLDPADVERKVTDKTRAVMPVHFAGYMADMDRLGAICSEHGLVLLEDAAHAWGSEWSGKGAGAIGVAGAFSFQHSKNITSAEGGIVLTDDAEFAGLVRSYTNCGRGKDTPWYQHFLLGSNLRLTEFQAVLLLAQLERLGEQTAIRAERAALLDEMLAPLPGVRLTRPEPRMTRRGHHLYTITFDTDALGVTRDRLAEALKAEGVPVVPPYPHPLYQNPLFQRRGEGPGHCPLSCPYYGREMDYTKVSCPAAERLLRDSVWLFHTVLLAPEAGVRQLAGAFEKVLGAVGSLR